MKIARRLPVTIPDCQVFAEDAPTSLPPPAAPSRGWEPPNHFWSSAQPHQPHARLKIQDLKPKSFPLTSTSPHRRVELSQIPLATNSSASCRCRKASSCLFFCLEMSQWGRWDSWMLQRPISIPWDKVLPPAHPKDPCLCQP